MALTKRIGLMSLVIVATLAMYQVRHARALNSPTITPLAYSGSLLTFGVPDNSSHTFIVAIFVAGANDGGIGSAACTTTAPMTCVNGQFSIPLSSACQAVVQNNPNITVETYVDSVPMGQVNVSAVPYALAVASAGATIVTVGSGRAWSDGTFAPNCAKYRNPDPTYAYQGVTGDGVYTIDPDGPGGTAPFNVWCDMTTANGGWTLVAASSGGTNMPKFTTTTVAPCTAASPSAPCFMGAEPLLAMPYSQAVWSMTPNATPTLAPIISQQDGANYCNAICVNDNEYYRMNQDSAAQGMGFTGCQPFEAYLPTSFCVTNMQIVWNLLTCNGLPDTSADNARSSPDYNCSPFGRYESACTEFYNMGHWRR